MVTKDMAKREDALRLRLEGLSLKEIADKIGVSRQRVQQLLGPYIETGIIKHGSIDEITWKRVKTAASIEGVTMAEWVEGACRSRLALTKKSKKEAG